MATYKNKDEWYKSAVALRRSGLTAKEVNAKVGKYEGPEGNFTVQNSAKGKDGLVVVDFDRRSVRNQKRVDMERRQSLLPGQTVQPRSTTSASKRAEYGAGPGRELHHRNSLIQNTPFLEDLTDEEAAEFVGWTKEQGWDLGNQDGNTNINLSKGEHTSVHAFMRENDIEGSRGPQARLTKRFKGASMSERKSAFRDYMAFVQRGVDEHMSDTLGDRTVSESHEVAQAKNKKIVDQRLDVARLRSNVGEIKTGPKTGQRLPVNRRTLGDAIIRDIQTPRVPRSSLKAGSKVGKSLKVPVLGGILAAGGTLLAGGSPAQAAGNFIDAENPLDGGEIANGTNTGHNRAVLERPNYYNKQGPDLSTPKQSKRAQQLRDNPARERAYETIGRLSGNLRDTLMSWFK